MDEVATQNQERWEALAKANVLYSRPYLELDRHTARDVVDPNGMIKETDGADVLLLASGGGQQSAAFALLGANVTVLDISETQLERDRQAAEHYRVEVRTFQGDMRDLSRFGESAFDIVYQPYSLNFVPDAGRVFNEVTRVLRQGGLYQVMWHNPFNQGIEERDWNGRGYPLRLTYVDGEEIAFDDPHWEVEGRDGTTRRFAAPREFRHALSTVLNGLVERGFLILGVWESQSADPDAEPGTWEHLQFVAPQWLTIWASYRPGTIPGGR